jgi:peptidyl-prolyl cis-trans isomerase B (cyclophilin B)
VASKRNRQRQLERARAERRIARQAAQTRRKRQIQAGIGASVAVVLIIVGTVWLLGGFKSKPPVKETVARGTCSWNLKDAATDPNVVDVGHPPTTGERHSGTENMTIRTNLGDIVAQLDLARTPCTAASFAYLAEKKFYEGVRCHRLDTKGHFVVCGDPHGDGGGIPSYSYADENLPHIPAPSPTPSNSASANPGTSPTAGASASAKPSPTPPAYRKGMIVMDNTGPDSNAGMFFIIYSDDTNLPPTYSIAGMITKGLDIVEKVAKAGAVDDTGASVPAGKLKTDLIMQALYVGVAPSAAPSPAPSASPGASASPSPNPAT